MMSDATPSDSRPALERFMAMTDRELAIAMQREREQAAHPETRSHAMAAPLRWAWVALAFLALLIVAQETRYVPRGGNSYYVWDRLGHRYCGIVPDHGWLCGPRLR